MIKLSNPNLNDLVQVIDFGFNFSTALKTAKTNDGKVDFNDWALLFPLIGEAGVAYQGADTILQAWATASKEDRTAVMNYVKEKFVLTNKATEAKIEKSFVIALVLVELLFNLKD